MLKLKKRPTRRAVSYAAALAVSAGALALAAPALAFTGVEGAQFSGEVGQVILACSGTDPNFDCSGMPATMSGAHITWADGVTDTVGAAKDSCDTSGGTCRYKVNGVHTYAEEGSYQVSFTVPNPNAPPINNPAHGTATGTISDAALTNPSGANLTATEGASASTFELGTFDDANPGASVSDFTATINWGDGTATSAGTVAVKGGGFDVSGTHAYADEGTRAPSVTVTDDGGQSTTINARVDVVDAPLSDPVGATLSARQGVLGSFALGSFLDGNPLSTASDFSATIDWGDGSATTTGTVSAGGSGRFNVDSSHTFETAGTKAVTVAVTDAGGASTSITDSVEVSTPASISALLRWRFKARTGSSSVRRLTLKHAHGGDEVTLLCRDAGCPFPRREITIAARKHRLRLAPRFDGARLHVGGRLIVELTHPDLVGRYYRFKIRAGRAPRVEISCLAPGSSKPGVGCSS